MNLKYLIALLLLTCGILRPALAGDAPIAIPLRPDPPITVDGKLDDWATVPSTININRHEQVIFQPESWKSADDLSATIHFAWRNEGLLIGAEVRDDHFSNSGSGADAFRGDHVELYFDATPDRDPSRKAFGAGQTHLILSPGNLADDRKAGSFGRINAEVFRAHPDSKSIPAANIAAVKNEKGWTIECFIPWEQLSVTQPKKGQKFRLEVAVSDCDSSASRQEAMMTISTREWDHQNRARLIDAYLADTGGKYVALAPAKPVVLLKDAVIPPKGEVTKDVDYSAKTDGSIPALFVRARLQYKGNSGDTYALHVYVNDQRIDGKRILNKPVEMKLLDGGTTQIFSAASFGFRIPYASTYEEANISRADGNPYNRFDSTEPRTDFLIDLSDLLKDGKNTLKFVSSDPSVEVPMHLEAEIRQVEPRAAAAAKREVVPATEYFTPEQPAAALSFKEMPNAEMKVSVGKSSYQVRSYFSAPGGQWVHGGNKFFSYSRKTRQEKGVIIVEDSFTNLGDQPLPIMQRHEISAADTQKDFYINGLKRPAQLPGYHQSNNCTSFMGTAAGGIGVWPLDDVFQIHGENYIPEPNTIGLCDRALVIGPKATHVVRWAMAGAADGDYFNFINTARRFLNVNFTLQGAGACMRMYPPYSDWPEEKMREQFGNRSAYYALSAPSFRVTYKGKQLPYLCNHGQAALDVSEEAAAAKKWKRAFPGIKVIQYYACFIDSSDDADTRFAADALLDAAGKPTTYGTYYYPLFVPTLQNEYGKACEQLVDNLLNGIDLDGIFWDELAYSMVPYHYGKPWDGVSGDIDMKTFEVKQLKSSVSLISKDWRIKQAKKILANGRTLIANGPVDCQEIRDMHIPAFTETGQASFCARTQLYTPIALGDHLSEVTEVDAYHNMLNALNYGCVYYWYSEDVNTTHKTLTEHMYPITPMRLGSGFLMGKERILTRNSGFFGWNDLSDFDVFVYDENGVLQTGTTAKRVVKDGHAFAQIDLKPDWSAAIVRKAGK